MQSGPVSGAMYQHPATDKYCSSQQRICLTSTAYPAAELAGLVQDLVYSFHSLACLDLPQTTLKTRGTY